MKYWEYFKIEFHQGLVHRGAALGRLVFYAVVLFIFSRLWMVVSQKANLEMGPVDMLWYLALTELIVLSSPLIHQEFEEDVQSGNLVYTLGRPQSYIWSKYAGGMGQLLSRVLFLSVAGFFFAWFFSGSLPTNPMGLISFLPLAILSMGVNLLFKTSIGILAFWMQDSTPVYWVYQKCIFILGGMMLPLDIYPPWLRTIAEYSPFSAFLYGPAQAALKNDWGIYVHSTLKLLLWGVIGVLLCELLFRKAKKNMIINGG